MNENNENIGEQLKKLIAELWERARINAFAHREAMNKSRKRESIWYIITISSSLLSILFMNLSYINNLNNSDNLPFVFLILSVIFAFVSLFATIFSNHMRYGITSEQHKFILNSYMHIAQRTRLAKKPNISTEKLLGFYDDLERDFADIKARGIEPQDKQFEKAEKIHEKRKQEKAPLSFATDADNQSETETNHNSQ